MHATDCTDSVPPLQRVHPYSTEIVTSHIVPAYVIANEISHIVTALGIENVANKLEDLSS